MPLERTITKLRKGCDVDPYFDASLSRRRSKLESHSRLSSNATALSDFADRPSIILPRSLPLLIRLIQAIS